MANWNLPTATSGYLDFVTEMNDKFTDVVTLQYNVGTNLPLQTIRWNRGAGTFQEWLGAVSGWQDKVLAIAGGGTGSTTASGIRTNLGLGSMSTQNSNAVAITGGSISGINLDAGGITSGILALARGGTGASLVIQPYGYILVSNGSGLVFNTGLDILQLNADRLVSGIVSDARLSANIPKLNTVNAWTGQNTFDGPESLALTSQWQYAIINMYSYSQPVNKKRVRFIYNGGIFSISTVDDGYTTTLVSLISIDSTGIISGNGSGLGINASNLNVGTVPIARLGTSGAQNTTTFLRGDNTWAVPPDTVGGSGGTPIPAGLVAMFDGNCPAGWTRFSAMDNRFPMGSTAVGNAGGAANHAHNFSAGTSNDGNHTHSVDTTGSGTGTANGGISGNTAGPDNTVQVNYDAGGSVITFTRDHFHAFSAPANLNVNVNISASGNTNNTGAHTHSVSGSTDVRDNLPPWYSIVFCRKD